VRIATGTWDDHEPELGPPIEWLPGRAEIELALGRRERGQVLLKDVLVYPAGWQFTIIYAHPLQLNADSIEAYGFPDLAFEYPDGRRFNNDDLIDDAIIEEAFVVLQRASRGPHGGDWDYWISPLPGAGNIVIGCEWPACGIEATTTKIDTAIIHDAASRVRPNHS
jgi:hypothetical protein